MKHVIKSSFQIKFEENEANLTRSELVKLIHILRADQARLNTMVSAKQESLDILFSKVARLAERLDDVSRTVEAYKAKEEFQLRGLQ